MIGKVIVGILLSLCMVYWVWALVDILKSDNTNFKQFAGDNGKIIWLLLILLVPFGALVYSIKEERMLFKEKELA